MIKDMTLGQYIPGKSMLHRSDPRVKIVLTTVYISLVLWIKTYVGYFVLVIFIIFVLLFCRIPLKYAIKGLRPVLWIITFTAMINLFTVDGTTVFQWGFLHMTEEGIHLTVKMLLKLSLLIVGSSLLTFTTTPILLTDGIEKLLGPLKRFRFPAHEIAMMMSIALRFIPTLFEEADKIMKAQASRGADFDTGNLIQRAKSFIPVLIPLFVNSFRRADELVIAMESRCYRGDEGRTRMKQLRLTRVDLEISLVMFIIGILIVLINIFTK